MPGEIPPLQPGSGGIQSASPEEIAAHGHNQVRMALIRYGFGTVIVLIVVGGLAWYHDPVTAKELWGYIIQMALPTVTGIIGYLAGDKAASQRTRR